MLSKRPTMRRCERCDSDLYELGQEPLCEECLAFMGPRPAVMDRVCLICADTWHASTLPMCPECFVTDGGPDLAN